MSAYIYAIIPYKSGIRIGANDPFQFVYGLVPQELRGIESEFTVAEKLELHVDFLLINTCCRESVFTNNSDGYSRMRADIYRIAKALGAKEAWYVEELATEDMNDSDFSFEEWVRSLKNEKKKYVAELSIDILKGNTVYSYYHDDFSDIIMEKPNEL
jgi:hypothetical protein